MCNAKQKLAFSMFHRKDDDTYVCPIDEEVPGQSMTQNPALVIYLREKPRLPLFLSIQDFTLYLNRREQKGFRDLSTPGESQTQDPDTQDTLKEVNKGIPKGTSAPPSSKALDTPALMGTHILVGSAAL